jgi:hypothetical protein
MTELFGGLYPAGCSGDMASVLPRQLPKPGLVMRTLFSRALLFFVSAGSLYALAETAAAQSPEFMMQDCRNLSRLFFDDFSAQSDVKYEGQRDDGTHFVNGAIFIGAGVEFFQCSYAQSQRRLLDFWAKNRSWPDFVAGGEAPKVGD